MLPMDTCRPDVPGGGIELNVEGGPTNPAWPTYRLELASLYLQDLQARDWEKLSTCLAAPTPPAQPAHVTVEYPDAFTRQQTMDNRPGTLQSAR